MEGALYRGRDSQGTIELRSLVYYVKVKNKPPTEKSFQKMIGAMPEHVPADALPNISVPYYFICLLHLANEKNLEIEQIEGDLRIKSNV